MEISLKEIGDWFRGEGNHKRGKRETGFFDGMHFHIHLDIKLPKFEMVNPEDNK